MQSSNKKILIVDDEPATRLLLAQIFTSQGHEAVCAEDGFAALQQMRQSMPDIILSDLNMPGMSGFEFLSVVRRKVPGIFVIASSGAYVGSNVPEGIPADAFYEKATDLRKLFEIVKEATPLVSREETVPPPLWIALDKNFGDGEAIVTISCPECMRVSVHLIYGVQKIFAFRKDPCVHCQTEVHYAIVKVLPPVLESHYHREMDRQMATQRRA